MTITAPHLCTPSPSPSPDFIHQTNSAGLAGYNRGDLSGFGLGGGWSYYPAVGEDGSSCEVPSMPDWVPGQQFRGQPSTPLRSLSPSYLPDTPSPMPDEHPVSPGLVEKFRALNRPSSRAHRQQLSNLGQRSSHRRLPSGSSIGSAGPESPYPQTSAFPHIVGLDTPPASSPYPEPLEIGYQGSTYAHAHTPTPFISTAIQRNFLAPEFQNLIPWNSDPDVMKAAEAAMARALEEQGRAKAGRQRSGLAHQSPYEAVGEEQRVTAGPSNPVPSLDRTVSDACQDELYNPAMAIATPAWDGSSYAPQTYRHSQQNQQFTKILQAANEKHLSARPVMPISREHSPFRQTSEFATERFPHTASTPHSPATRLNAAGSPREQQEIDAAARNYHLPTMQRDTAPARTISPKESLLRHNEAEADAKMPLFPPSENLHRRENQFPSTNSNSRHLFPSDVENHEFQQRYDHPRANNRPIISTSAAIPTPPGPEFTFLPPSLPSIPSNASSSSSSSSMSLQTPKQYPFISNPRRQGSSRRSLSDSDPDPQFPAVLSSMESTRSETDPQQLTRFMSGGEAPHPSSSSSDVERPSDTVAGTGSYQCPIASCAQRFDTSAKLQKHRREAHRADPSQRSPATPTVPSSSTSEMPGHGRGGSTTTPTATHTTSAAATTATTTSSSSTTTTTANRNNHAGPHKCTRPNPNSNKPCNTVFSRSYDLTRHEETVHNRSKVKIQCALCTVEKTFSRGDALSRHVRVMHPGVDYPGKTKKRGS